MVSDSTARVKNLRTSYVWLCRLYTAQRHESMWPIGAGIHAECCLPSLPNGAPPGSIAFSRKKQRPAWKLTQLQGLFVQEAVDIQARDPEGTCYGPSLDL